MARIVHGIATARVSGDVEVAREAVDIASATDAVNLHADARAALADVLASLGEGEATTQRRIALDLYELKGNAVAVEALLRTAASGTRAIRGRG